MGNLTFLVVDDEASVRAFIAAVLRRDGYTTIEAEHGEEALELVRAAGGNIALIVSDIRMPRMNGSMLAKALRREYPSIRILLMSGYSDKIPEEFPFIAKPFGAEELSSAVAAVLQPAAAQ